MKEELVIMGIYLKVNSTCSGHQPYVIIIGEQAHVWQLEIDMERILSAKNWAIWYADLSTNLVFPNLVCRSLNKFGIDQFNMQISVRSFRIVKIFLYCNVVQ